MRRRLSRRGDAGAVVVETALVIPVLLMLLIGIMIFGLRMIYVGVAENAASMALRTATLQVSPDTYPTETAVRSIVEGLRSVDLLGDPSCGPGSAPTCKGVQLVTGTRQGAPVKVTVRYDVPVLRTVTRLWPFGDFSSLSRIERSAEGRLE